MPAGTHLRLLRLIHTILCLYMAIYAMELPGIGRDSYNLDKFDNITNETIRDISISLFLRCLDTPFCTVPDRGVSDLQLIGKKCCLTCNCDSACVKTGTCCADIQSLTKPIRKESTNQDLVECLPAQMQGERDRKRYGYVTKCRGNFNPDESYFCDRPMDSWPVYDIVDHMHYRHIDCVECNNVTRANVAMWPKLYECTFIVNNGGSEPRRKRDANKIPAWGLASAASHDWKCYTIKFIPPLASRHDMTTCRSQVVTRCNVTGPWNSKDSAIQTACETLDMRYDHYWFGQFRNSYKNVFCAICNGVDPKVGKQQSSSCHDYTAITSRFAYYMVFYKEVPSDVTVRNDNHCQDGHRVDPITTLCKPIYCGHPLQLDNSGNECIESWYISKTKFTVTVSMDLLEPITVSKMEEISEQFSNKLDLLGILGVGNVDVYIKTSSPYSSLKVRYSDWEAQKTSHVTAVVVAKQTSDSKQDVRVGRLSTAFNRLKEAITAVWNDTLTAHDIRFRIVDDDTGMLPWRWEGRTTQVQMEKAPPLDPGDLPPLLSTIAYLFEDPYGRTVTIAFELRKRFFQTPAEKAFITTFSKSFIEVPTFLYEIKAHNITREPDGLRFVDEQMTFGFHEFRSANVSHVYIRVDSVVKMMEPTTSGGHCPCCRSVLINVMGWLIMCLYSWYWVVNNIHP